jgi:hypothetical protein
MMSDRFVVEADHRVVGIAVRVRGGFRFFTSDRRFRSLELRTFPKLKAIVRRAGEIARARTRRPNANRDVAGRPNE